MEDTVSNFESVALHARLDARTGTRALCNQRTRYGDLCAEQVGHIGPRQPEGTIDPERAMRILQLPFGMAPDARDVWGWTEGAEKDRAHGRGAGFRQQKSLKEGRLVNGWIIGPERLPVLVECRCGHLQWLTCQALRLSPTVPYKDMRVGGRQERWYTITELTNGGETVEHSAGAIMPPQRKTHRERRIT